MNKTALSLLLALAGVVSTAPAQAVQGDATAGAAKNAQCIGCHGIPGYRASFPQVHRVPMIAGQNSAYLSAALTAYRQGQRKHPTMRAVAASLSDQDIADLAAFYAQQSQAPSSAAATPAELPADLKDKLTTCTACHGADFNRTTDPANPRLAGQYPDYLTVALKAYQHSDHALLGRSNPVMGGMAAMLNEAEVKRVAEFLGGLPSGLATVPNAKMR